MATSPTLLDSAQLETSQRLRQRVRNSLSTYANYLMATGPEDPQYDAKIQAAKNMGANPDMAVNALMFWLSGDAEVKAGGESIDDATLQSVVEKTLQKLYPIG
jgi:hypothetical protein